MSSKRSFWLTVCITFFVVGMVLYGASLGNGFVHWDDGLLIYENAAVRGLSLTNLKTIFTTYDPELYIPLTLFSYQIDYLISGSNPTFYHFHNLVLHILNAILVVALLRLFTKQKLIAVLCGVLFLVHPLHTEAVAWSSARKDLLSSLFMLLSMLSYFTYKQHHNRRLYIASLAAFALGLLAKVTILGLPLLLLLGRWYQCSEINRATWKESAPFFGLSVVFAIIAALGKTTILSSVTLLETVAMAGKSTAFYLMKFIVPTKLSVLYPYNEQIHLLSPDFLVPYVVVCVIALATLASLKFNKIIAFGMAFFVITLAPSLLNFAKAGTYYIASDRYAYLPSIGLLLIVAATVAKLKDKRIGYGALTIIVALFAYGAHAQSMIWKDSETLFSHALKLYPKSHAARNNIGNVYRRNGQTAKAIEQYQAALAIEPYAGKLRTELGKPSSLERNTAQIRSNLGSAYRALGNLPEALNQFTAALEHDDQNPQVHLGLAITRQQMGNFSEAESHFKQAIELQPNLAVAYLNLGALYVNSGQIEAGITQYELATDQNPQFPQAHYNLGIALRKMQRNREAKEAFEKAVALEPSFVAARINLGILYAERQDISDAIEQFQEVLKYDPDNANALSALSQLGAR